MEVVRSVVEWRRKAKELVHHWTATLSRWNGRIVQMREWASFCQAAVMLAWNNCTASSCCEPYTCLLWARPFLLRYLGDWCATSNNSHKWKIWAENCFCLISKEEGSRRTMWNGEGIIFAEVLWLFIKTPEVFQNHKLSFSKSLSGRFVLKALK